MTWQQEFWSWMSPSYVKTAEPPAVGQKAPSTPKLTVPKDGKPTIIAFLRHCGCPFAEKTFLNMRDAAATNPNIHFIAVSHSDQESTDHWLAALPDTSKNTQPNLQIVIDAEREAYAAYGLGISSFYHVLSPAGLSNLNKLGKEEGIWNRPTESGNRWQTGGNYGIDKNGIVQWNGKHQRADDMSDFKEGIPLVSAH
ncbi:hypothetical protein C7974DRAFT_371152 [Boeremia exigua]|uniref:uncharacterized protein n=1 Tax=Boeremia exigua TaxID=749465 RepID=UPI001E8DF225|nr:uncharacterized protein C7974DRAFT_371152 [Boeremia exigua]KAH6643980.1 hypothetical protein C7974DRAFT_371152 [Boeremia exigua]